MGKQIKDLNELNYIINKYKPKTNTMLTKKKLKQEIDELKEDIESIFDCLKSQQTRISILIDRVTSLEDPPKYKVGQIIGKFTITEYCGHVNFMCTKNKEYSAIKKGELVKVSETKLNKITKTKKK